MTSTNKPYHSEAEEEAATKPAPVPDESEAETLCVEDEGDPLGGNVA